MELTMTWSLIFAGSALLLIGAVSRHVWPRLKFWLALTQAAADRDPERIGEQAFQDNLRSLATRTSRQRSPTGSTIQEPQLDQSTAQARILVG
jgi:hypothetical protein